MASYSGNPHTDDATLRSVATTFANARSGSGTLSVISGSATAAGPSVDAQSDWSNFYIDRFVMPFDTASLGVGAVASAGTLSFYVNGLESPDVANTQLDLIGYTLASAPTIATSDWGSAGTTQLATRLSFAPGTTGTQTFTLNASGLAYITGAAYTVFAIVMANDYANSPSSPTDIDGHFGASYSYMSCNTANAGSNKPTLALTYTPGTPPGAPTPLLRRDRSILPLYSFPEN